MSTHATSNNAEHSGGSAGVAYEQAPKVEHMAKKTESGGQSGLVFFLLRPIHVRHLGACSQATACVQKELKVIYKWSLV